MIVEPCACGGSIVALSLDVCAPAVERHNRTAQHRTWRAQGGFTPYNPAHGLFLTGLALSQEMQPGEYVTPVPYVRLGR